MNELLTVALLTLLAVISPGADFAVITRNSLQYGRGHGLLGAFGIALGVQFHVLCSLLGVSLLLSRTPWLLAGFKLLGAAYLLYIGYRTFVQPPLAAGPAERDRRQSAWAALRAGLLCNALNPKTSLFVLSLFSQAVNADTPLSLRAGYGLFISAAHLAWFALVALLFTQPRLHAGMLRRQRGLNRIIGCALIGLGTALALR
ncbi:lysine transporter LysE [Chromobacterium haemolyticum]|uniref:LysE family transporter n=1 Tax=Chromobacterium haemolyticum TaxID=394935 RepID=UPI0005BCDBC2|nr:LysE family transporter [Chromobacterium haemolyticum]OQS32429.1 lysine transporter LysE [Chromobacterium haemolyticum]